MKKKLLITFGAALSLLALASCGNNTDNGKKLENSIVKDVFGKTLDSRSFKSMLTTETGGKYGRLSYGYYYTSTAQGNVIVKSFVDESYSVDLGIKDSDIKNRRNYGAIVEIVTASGDKYKHTFYSFKGEKITEKTTDFYSTFNVDTSSFELNADYLTSVEYFKYDFEYESGDNLTKVTIYEKETYDEKNEVTTYEFQLTDFGATEVVKDATKVGDYYVKEFDDSTTKVVEFYDSEGKIDDKLVIEDGSLYRGAFAIGDNVVVYQRSIPVSSNSDYDYFSDGTYYKLDSFMIDTEKHKMKELDLKYVVSSQVGEFDGEYTAITYRNVIDRRLEYTSIGFVDDDFDIKYSLPNESKLEKVKGGYYSSATQRLYNENFEVVKEFKGTSSISLSIDKSYLVVKYSDYTVVVDTATGNIITEGKNDKLTYSNNMIVKTSDTAITIYDVVNGSLVQRMSSTETNKSINSDSSYYYLVTTKGTDYDTVQIYAYGSNTALTAYCTSGAYATLSLAYNSEDMLYFEASNLYTNADLTTRLRLAKVESYYNQIYYA